MATCSSCFKEFKTTASLASHRYKFHSSKANQVETNKRKATSVNSDLFSDSSFYKDIKRQKLVGKALTDTDLTLADGDIAGGHSDESDGKNSSVVTSDTLSLISNRDFSDREASNFGLRAIMRKLKWMHEKIRHQTNILENVKKFIDLQSNKHMEKLHFETPKTSTDLVSDLVDVQQLFLKKNKTKILANVDKVQTAFKIMLLTMNMSELSPEGVQLFAMIALHSKPEKLIKKNMNTLKLLIESLEETFSEIIKLEGFEAAEEQVTKSDSESSISDESDLEEEKTVAEDQVAKSDSSSSEDSDSEKEITAVEEHATKSESESSNSEKSDSDEEKTDAKEHVAKSDSENSSSEESD